MTTYFQLRASSAAAALLLDVGTKICILRPNCVRCASTLRIHHRVVDKRVISNWNYLVDIDQRFAVKNNRINNKPKYGIKLSSLCYHMNSKRVDENTNN